MLLIDDDQAVLIALARGMRRQHEVFTARTSTDAERIVRERGPSLDWIVCDVSMPETHGVALREVLLALVPALATRFIFMTGGGHDDAMLAALADTGCLVLEKPIDGRAIAGHISSLMAQAPRRT